MSDIQYWNYRVVKQGTEPNASFIIAEIYYDPTDRYVGWCQPKPSGDSTFDLEADLELMLEAFKQPVIDEADLPGNTEEDEDISADLNTQ